MHQNLSQILKPTLHYTTTVRWFGLSYCINTLHACKRAYVQVTLVYNWAHLMNGPQIPSWETLIAMSSYSPLPHFAAQDLAKKLEGFRLCRVCAKVKENKSLWQFFLYHYRGTRRDFP